MGRLLGSKGLSLICRVTLGLVFILSALGKIGDPREFSDAVAAYKILPITSVNVFAIILPWLELLVGLSLFSGTRIRESALLSIIMNLMFIAAVSSAMARGLDIKCGCFTLSKEHSGIGWIIIGRDVLFVLIAVPVLISNGKLGLVLRDTKSIEELLCNPTTGSDLPKVAEECPAGLPAYLEPSRDVPAEQVDVYLPRLHSRER